MLKNSNGRLIRISGKRERIYIRQGIVYFVHCIEEDEEE